MTLTTRLPKMRKLKIVMFTIAVIFPLLIILFTALYMGFLGSHGEFSDPCKIVSKQDTCDDKTGCIWDTNSSRCKLDSKCTNINSQQACSEGCVWDASIKRYNSNLYGLCVPLFT